MRQEEIPQQYHADALFSEDRTSSEQGQNESGYCKTVSSNAPEGEMEIPGALAGATGDKKEVEKLHEERYSPVPQKAIARPLTGAWNTVRWEWLKAIQRDPMLAPISKCLATVLVTQAADHASAECRWSTGHFVDALGVTERTVKRAFKELGEAGWLIRTEGRGRGIRSEISFTSPVVVSPADREKGDKSVPSRPVPHQEKGDNIVTFSGGMKGQKLSEKVTELSRPPTPPYKDTPNSLQKARASGRCEKPHLNLAAVAHFGSDRENEWDEYLLARSWPRLSDLAVKSSDKDGTGWEIPFRRPPSRDNAFETRITSDWVSWAMERMEARHVVA